MQSKLDKMKPYKRYELLYYDKDLLFGMYVYAKSRKDAIFATGYTSFDEFESLEEIIQTIYTFDSAKNPLNIIMN